MKRILTTLAVLAFSTVAASAAVVSFVDEAAGNERGLASGSIITDIQGSGLDVQLFSGSGSPYLDDLSGGKPGGLGACSVLSTNDQCNPSSDDNVDAGEMFVQVLFRTTGTTPWVGGNVNTVSLYDAGHNLFSGMIGLNGSVYNVAGGLLSFGLAGLDFGADGLKFDWFGKDFYVGQIGSQDGLVVNPVPLPASTLFLGTALGALAVWGRKKRKAA